MPVSFIPFVFPGVDNVRCAFQTRWQEAGDGPYAGVQLLLIFHLLFLFSKMTGRASSAIAVSCGRPWASGAWPNSIRCTAMP